MFKGVSNPIFYLDSTVQPCLWLICLCKLQVRKIFLSQTLQNQFSNQITSFLNWIWTLRELLIHCWLFFSTYFFNLFSITSGTKRLRSGTTRRLNFFSIEVFNWSTCFKDTSEDHQQARAIPSSSSGQGAHAVEHDFFLSNRDDFNGFNDN